MLFTAAATTLRVSHAQSTRREERGRASALYVHCSQHCMHANACQLYVPSYRQHLIFICRSATTASRAPCSFRCIAGERGSMDAAVAHALAQKKKQRKRERRGASPALQRRSCAQPDAPTDAATAAGVSPPTSGKKQRRGEDADAAGGKRSRKEAAARPLDDPDEEEAEPAAGDDADDEEGDGGAPGGAGEDGEDGEAGLRTERFGADGQKVTVQANGILSESGFSTLPLSEATLTVRARTPAPHAGPRAPAAAT